MDMNSLTRLADAVWAGREAVNATMEELARYIYPDARGFTGKVAESDEGRREIWDSTAEEAASMLASALGGLLTNPSTDWFSLELAGGGETDGEGASWLTEAGRAMLAAFAAPESGFYQEIDAFYMELAALAWAALFIEYRDGKGLSFRAVPVSQCAVAENAQGRVDTLVRRFTMTASQMAEEFEVSRFSDEAKNALGREPMRPLELTHIVLPRAKAPAELLTPSAAPHAKERGPEGTEAPPRLRLSAKHAYVSVIFEKNAEAPLQAGGYFEFPFAVARWSKRPGEVYGRGCGHAALPDIRVLNRVSLSQLDAAEKASNPPLLVPDDSVLAGQKINTFAGGITYWRPGAGEIATLPVATDLSAMQAIREERKDSIRRLFLNDRLLLTGGPQMTATEVVTRDRKQALALGPVLGRLQSEQLGPLIERAFGLLLRAGELPELPSSLRGRHIRVRYVSPIARAQKQGEAESFLHALQFAEPLARLDPSLMDNFDADVIIRDTREVFGYPPKYLKDAEAVARERQERLEARLAEEAAAQDEAAASGPVAPGSGAPGSKVSGMESFGMESFGVAAPGSGAYGPSGPEEAEAALAAALFGGA